MNENEEPKYQCKHCKKIITKFELDRYDDWDGRWYSCPFCKYHMAHESYLEEFEYHEEKTEK